MGHRTFVIDRHPLHRAIADSFPAELKSMFEERVRPAASPRETATLDVEERVPAEV